MAESMTYKQAAKELGLSPATIATYTLPSHGRRLERVAGNRVTTDSVLNYMVEREKSIKEARRKAGKTMTKQNRKARAALANEQQPDTKQVRIRPVSVREEVIMLRGMLTFIDMDDGDRSKLMGHVKKIESALS